MEPIALRVQDLGKCYRLRTAREGARYRTLRDEITDAGRRLLSGRWGGGVATEQFWALREVCFEVREGDVLGVVGRNGAGKSTLLKTLSRIIGPTEGEVDIYGRVGSLLEVGTGFHPELSGRENIFLSGAILGMSRREVRAQLDEIVDFAGVERFLDTPCKYYSSGMYARLGFAVAAHLRAEILLLDEILSVGDAVFRERCQRKIRDVVGGSGRTIMIVSHDLAMVRNLCRRVLWLDQGRVRMDGFTGEVLDAYHRAGEVDGMAIAESLSGVRAGLRVDCVMINGVGSRRVALPSGATRLDFHIEGDLEHSTRMSIEVRLYDQDNLLIGLFSPGHERGRVETHGPGRFVIRSSMRLPLLLTGVFRLQIDLTDPGVLCLMSTGPVIDLLAEGVGSSIGTLRSGSQCGCLLIPEIDDAN